MPPWTFQTRWRRDLETDTRDPSFPLISMPPVVAPAVAWEQLQQANQTLGSPFYEGLVAKRADSPYPFQLRDPQENFAFWVKHRWKW